MQGTWPSLKITPGVTVMVLVFLPAPPSDTQKGFKTFQIIESP